MLRELGSGGLLAVLLWLPIACGGRASEGARGATGAGGATGGGGGRDASGGAGVGGAPASGGSGGLPSGGDGGATEPEAPVLVEPDPDEPCAPDPEEGQWVVTSFPQASISGLTVGAGGALRIVAYAVNEWPSGETGLFVRTSTAAGLWSEPVEISPNAPTGMSIELRVARDGSGALLAWEEESSPMVSVFWDEAWSPPGEGPGIGYWPGGHAEMLSGGRAVVAWGDSSGINTREYEAGQWRAGDNVLTNDGGLFLSADEQLVAYGWSSYVAGGDSRIPYTFGVGFGEPELLPVAETDSYFSRVAFEFANGRGARVMQRWADEATAGLYVTAHSDGIWGSEERVAPYVPSGSDPVAMTFAGHDLLLLWDDEEHIQQRHHDGTAWTAPASLPRSRAAALEAWAGSLAGSAVVVATQTIVDEGVAATKIWRRGTDGTWYCPRLVSADGGLAAASADSGAFLVSHRRGDAFSVAEFVP